MEEVKQITIYLPSLIHRMDRNAVKLAKSVITPKQGKLTRIRRSRNWQLTCKINHLDLIIDALVAENSEVLGYLINKLDEKLEQSGLSTKSIDKKLTKLITDNPSITLSELMAKTNCSVSQARIARFNVKID